MIQLEQNKNLAKSFDSLNTATKQEHYEITRPSLYLKQKTIELAQQNITAQLTGIISENLQACFSRKILFPIR